MMPRVAPLLVWAITSGACGGAPPPRPATEVAVGSTEWNLVRMAEWSVELPAEALSHVRLTWRDGHRSAELTLSGAPIGTSVERMADDEAHAMRSLEPSLEVVRRRVRVAGVVGVGLRQGARDVVVAMRNPWRALRLDVRGEPDADAWWGEVASVANVGLAPRLPLDSARFECDAWAITIERASGRWALHVRAKTHEPDSLDRIRRSFSPSP